MRIARVYIPYWEWEDWKEGMWRKINDKEEENILLQKAIEFTGDWVKYGTAMQKVVTLWPNTMLNTLTNVSANRRAFLGHCAVQMEINCPEYITRLAWKELTDKQREEADEIAQLTIDEWIEEYARKN